MQPMPDLNAFAKQCHEDSKAKGWLDDERSFEDYAMLMVSELVEALEEFRDGRMLTELYYEVKFTDNRRAGAKMCREHVEELARREGIHSFDAKPCGIPVELADFVIRVGQFCGTHEYDFTLGGAEAHFVFDSFTAMLAHASRLVLSIDKEAAPLVNAVLLGGSFCTVRLFCEKRGIDLWAAVEEKQAYNRTRPHKHGGKKL